MEHSGHRDWAKNDVGSSTRGYNLSAFVRLRRKRPERPEAERGIQIALRARGKGQPIFAQGRRPIYSSEFVAVHSDANDPHLDGNLASWHINGFQISSDLRDHGLIIAYDDRV